MKVVALAGGIGAGKFLRGVARIVSGDDLTVILNVADDVVVHGLHVSPDPDSVTYWLGGVFDRERGWGRAGETFRATEELRAFDAPDAWFNLGDLDLATHVVRSEMLDPIETRIDGVDATTGERLDLHFQEYWVGRHGADTVKDVRYRGAPDARPAPGVLAAIGDADAVLVCPSNPVVSIGPILAVPGVREAVAARRDCVAGVSPIIAGAPVAGMADRLMPAMGFEVSAAGVAAAYADLLGGWVIDSRDAPLASRIEAMGLRVAVTDTIMVDDAAAERIGRTALGLIAG